MQFLTHDGPPSIINTHTTTTTDYGLGNFEALSRACNFPWLLSNVLDAQDGEPLGGAARCAVVEHAGVRVGLMGLAEAEWCARCSLLLLAAAAAAVATAAAAAVAAVCATLPNML